MSVKIIDGDLFNTNAKYICHQVNCRGKMGSGVAAQVRNRYPEVCIQYMELCGVHRQKWWLLGRTQFVPCPDGKTIVNMFAQDRYGYDSEVYTNYEAFESCLEEIAAFVPKDAVIAMPYKIGCGLGGGNWDNILKLIMQVLSGHTVELWKKGD